MWFWKRKKKEDKHVIISTECHAKLPENAKKHFDKVPDYAFNKVSATHEVVYQDDYHANSENFGLSMIMADMTGSTVLGYIAGGSLSGAMVGEMMHEESHDHGGGDFGGSADISPSLDSSSFDSGSTDMSFGSSLSDSTSSMDMSGGSSLDSGGGAGGSW